MFLKKVYCCPCLMKFADEMENLLINVTDGILCFLKEIEKNEVLSKIYCVKKDKKSRWSYDLVWKTFNCVDFSESKYNCSAEEGGVLIEKSEQTLL